MKKIKINGHGLTIEEVIAVAHQKATITIEGEGSSKPKANTALGKVKKAEEHIAKKVANNEIIYGVTTGFGYNVDKVIFGEDAKQLQKNLLISHACGIGEPFSKEMVRAIMLIRLNTLLKGHSGAQVATVKLLKDFINKGIHPMIPSQGSVGASGDLCPLAHMASALIGYGMIEMDGKTYKSYTAQSKQITKALAKKGLTPIELAHKEGLALSNGTTIMAALGVVGVTKAKKLIHLATLCSSLMMEALGARSAAFDKKVHELRYHQGQKQIAANIRKFTKGSKLFGITTQKLVKLLPKEITQSLPEELQENLAQVAKGKAVKIHPDIFYLLDDEWEKFLRFADSKTRSQDSYSMRCTPQVFGASLGAIEYVSSVIQNELNAVVDNPIIFCEEDEIISAGNFHGQPIALALDHLKLAVAEVGNLLERQINKLHDPHHNDHLPAFLIQDAGLNSGLMITQYAAAGLVSENKVLVHPASADSIPTCANQEDHVSMGPIAGRQALEIIHNVEKILAIAMLTAAQAVDMRQAQFTNIGLKAPTLGKETKALYDRIRTVSKTLHQDRFLYADIEAVLLMMNDEL